MSLNVRNSSNPLFTETNILDIMGTLNYTMPTVETPATSSSISTNSLPVSCSVTSEQSSSIFTTRDLCMSLL